LWIPKDELGVAEDEIVHTRETYNSIGISCDGASLNAQGKLILGGQPPDWRLRSSGFVMSLTSVGRIRQVITESILATRAITFFTSNSSKSMASLVTGEQKHIQFNEQVEQCIALEIDGDKDGELDSSSRKASRASLSVDSKTIAMLPSTTLNNEDDVLEPLETAVKHNNFFSGDSLEDHNTNMDWQSQNAFANSKDSMVVTQERLQNLQTPGSSPSLNGNSLDIRHTPSDIKRYCIRIVERWQEVIVAYEESNTGAAGIPVMEIDARILLVKGVIPRPQTGRSSSCALELMHLYLESHRIISHAHGAKNCLTLGHPPLEVANEDILADEDFVVISILELMAVDIATAGSRGVDDIGTFQALTFALDHF
ncbi:hypothetical protein V502_02302, partial [Pseudogymnoascus sp. VKM F-4520 (FW-2644)]